MEEYRKIGFINGYEVSNNGNIRNQTTQKILACRIEKKTGYRQIHIRHRTYYLHRIVASIFIDNPQVKRCVDHIDNNKLNNNVSNLRWVTHSENKCNTGVYSNNKLGVKGVCMTKEKKYRASLTFNKHKYHLGHFETLEQAKQARLKKAEEIIKEYRHSSEKIITTK